MTTRAGAEAGAEAGASSRSRPGVRAAGLVMLCLLALPFAHHAASLGLRSLAADLSGESYLFAADAPVAEAALSAHMLAGAAITLLAPLQLVGPLRRRWPALHRWSGRVVTAAAGAAALGGLAFIALRGTAGGPAMSAGFAAYGALTLVAAVETARHAAAGRLGRHRAWALRLFVLAIGSWLYRVHHGLWHLATGGAWSEPDFSGAFDLVQNWAFFVPYLALVEWHLFRRRRARAPPRCAPWPQPVAPRARGS